MNTDTYGIWLLCCFIAIPICTIPLGICYGLIGVVIGVKFPILMMLLGRCFWKRNHP